MPLITHSGLGGSQLGTSGLGSLKLGTDSVAKTWDVETVLLTEDNQKITTEDGQPLEWP